MFTGMIWHIIAKIVFVLGSYLLHFYLGQKLSVEEYGIVGTIITIINFDYLFFSNGARQAVSKTIAQNKYDVWDIIKKGSTVQIIIVFIIFVANFKGSTIIASLLGDHNLINYIKYVAYLIPFTGIYFLCLGILNGFRLFKSEAIIAIIYPILKLGVIIFVNYFQPIEGTITGFLAAVIIIAIISLHQVYLNRKLYIKREETISYQEFLKTTLSYSILFSVVSVIMNCGILFLRHFSQNNTIVGYYTGCTTFGQVPYFLLTAIYLVTLPVITKYYNEANLSKVRQVIKDILLLVVVILLPVATIIAGYSGPILTTFYKNEFIFAANSLSILILGTFCLGITIILNMIISSTNQKKFNTILSLVMLSTQIILCYLLTKKYHINGPSISLFIVAFVSMSISYLYLKNILGKILERKHFLIILSNIILFYLTKLFSKYITSNSFLFTLLLCAITYIIHFIILMIFMKINPKNLIKKLLGK